MLAGPSGSLFPEHPPREIIMSSAANSFMPSYWRSLSLTSLSWDESLGSLGREDLEAEGLITSVSAYGCHLVVQVTLATLSNAEADDGFGVAGSSSLISRC